jgi:hypothetical protein
MYSGTGAGEGASLLQGFQQTATWFYAHTLKLSGFQGCQVFLALSLAEGHTPLTGSWFLYQQSSVVRRLTGTIVCWGESVVLGFCPEEGGTI